MSESMMGTKYDLSEFDRGMIVGSLTNSLTTDLLDFHALCLWSSERTVPKTKKHAVSGNHSGKNTLLLREGRITGFN